MLFILNNLFSQASLCSNVLTLPSKVGFGVNSVFINWVDVVFRRLQGTELRAQVTVLAAVGPSGALTTQMRQMLNKQTDEDRCTIQWMKHQILKQYIFVTGVSVA